MRLTLCLPVVASAILLAACTTNLHVGQAPAFEPEKALLQVEQPDRFWWQLRFKLTWPEEEQPDFSGHLLLAEQVMLPLITQYEQQLPLWRFHRRAGRDGAGHQFSLIFLADQTTAAAIDTAVNSDPLTLWLIESHMLEKTHLGKRSREELAGLENTSDPDWPIEIQRSWPYFIMGASQSWLMLVQELSAEQPLGEGDGYPALLQHYRDVDTRLNNQWREYGQHAYLHHLNAVFGYQPIKIRSSELQTF